MHRFSLQYSSHTRELAFPHQNASNAVVDGGGGGEGVVIHNAAIDNKWQLILIVSHSYDMQMLMMKWYVQFQL